VGCRCHSWADHLAHRLNFGPKSALQLITTHFRRAALAEALDAFTAILDRYTLANLIALRAKLAGLLNKYSAAPPRSAAGDLIAETPHPTQPIA
jgi:hypothetical protein